MEKTEINFSTEGNDSSLGKQKRNRTDERFDLDRSHLDVLLQAKRAWDNIEHFRKKRCRSRNYTFGKQWNDKIETPDGRTITEEQYLKEQGKIPLKNNLVRQIVKNIVGQFRNVQTEPVCISRDREEQKAGEMMSVAMQYVYQMNHLWEIDGRTMEEFVVSGTCFHKIGYGWRNNRMDVWVDVVNPNRIFFNAMEDVRLWDCTLIGELHDVPIADVVSKFAKGSRRRAKQLRELYNQATREEISRSFEALTSDNLDNLDFLIATEPHLCRIIEVWTLENKERLRCHDTLTGDYYKEEMERMQEIEAINRKRLEEAAQKGIAPEKVALIETEWFIDRYWYYRFFTPFGHILDEGETPYWHGEHPYVFKLYPLMDGEIHSFVEDIIDQQRYINRLITLIDFIMGASAKGVLLFPEDQIPDGMSIEDVAEQWTRYNGIILFKPKPGGVLPQQISTNATNVGAYELLNLQLRLIEDISGIHGAMQGKVATTVTSGVLYAQQTQNSSLNLIDLFESFKSFREERDTKVMKTVQQFYREARYLNIAGSVYDQEAKMYNPQKVRDVEFDLSICESSTNPTYRMASNELLMELFRMGQISLEMLLENGSFPFADRVLQSIQQVKEKMQQELLNQQQTMANGYGMQNNANGQTAQPNTVLSPAPNMPAGISR